MQPKLEDFIRLNASKSDLCSNYNGYSKEIKQMLKNVYSCCFRFCLHRPQILFLLNKIYD